MKFCLKENHSMNHILCIHKETEFFSLIFVINRLNFSKIFTKTIIALTFVIFLIFLLTFLYKYFRILYYTIINRFYRSILQRINRCRMGSIENMAINRRATRLNVHQKRCATCIYIVANKWRQFNFIYLSNDE